MKRPKRKFTSTVSTGARDRWVLSYADFITLLFAFFTTLYAASSVDAARFSTVASGLNQAITRTEQAPLESKSLTTGGDGVLPGERALVQMRRELRDVLDLKELRLMEDRRGLVLSIPEAGAFPAGSADISATANDLIGRIATALNRVPNAVRVEGHTDGTPIHTARFASNWELSTARATSVVEFLIERGGIAPNRLSAAGYAEFHPVADNQDSATRFRNRRVDIIILNSATKSAEEPFDSAQGRPEGKQ